jgi:hypothetical protein
VSAVVAAGVSMAPSIIPASGVGVGTLLRAQHAQSAMRRHASIVALTGAEFPGPGPAVEAHCSGCDRPGRYGRERLAERFGPDLRLPASYGRNKQGPAERT